MNRRFFPLALAAASVVQGAVGQAPAPRVVDLTTPEGTTLKPTDFPASKPGPEVMLFHQCNRDRKMWEELAPRLVAAGLNVLTLDFRGYGDSGGTAKFKVPPEEGRWLVTEVWPRRGELLAAAVERQAVPGSFNSVWPRLGAGHTPLGMTPLCVMSLMISYQSDFNPGLFQNAQIGFGGAAVGDHFLQV